MGNIERVDNSQYQRQVSKPTDQLGLYDAYGSVAYGVILQILPQVNLAQEVLIDLFSSPELTAGLEQPGSIAVHIIRLARTKALAAKTKSTATDVPSFPNESVTTTADLPKLIFTLSFCEGCTPEQIAEQLHISKSDVLTAIHTHFKSFRPS